MKSKETYDTNYDKFLARESEILRRLGGVSVENSLDLINDMED